MTKRKLILVIGAMMIAASLSACGDKEEATTEATTAATTEAATEEATEATASDTMLGDAADSYLLPKYEFPDDDPILIAISNYMVDTFAANYEKADVAIPIVQVLDLDDSNPDDVLVWGCYAINNYNLKEDILSCESGGNYPGCMHLKKSGEGYEVASFDVVEDGSNWDDSAKEIFGDKYDAFIKLNSDDVTREEVRKVTIADYVGKNSLPITKYQDYGADPVELVPEETEEEPATEAEGEEAPVEESSSGADYSMVTNLDAATVEATCLQAKTAYIDGDWNTLAGLIAYPITMYPEVTCNNEEEFIAYMDGKHVDESDMTEIKNETCTDMFINGQGICLGSGQMWLSGVGDGNNLKVISVTGIVN